MVAQGQTGFLDPKVITSIQGMPLRAKTVVEGFLAGLHRSPFKGWSVEFAEHRQYMPGDDPKTIDWKVFARTERMYVKQYEEENNLSCFILLDASGSMGYGGQGTTKLAYGATLAASLAWLAMKQRDQVGFAAFDSSLREYLPCRGGKGHLRNILRVLESLAATGRTDFEAPLDRVAEMLRRRGMVIVISDFLEPDAPILRAMRHLRFRRHDMLVFQVLDPHEVEFPFEYLSTFEDMETGERVLLAPQEFRKRYRQRFDAFASRLRAQVEAEGMDFAMMTTATPLDQALFSYLAGRRIRV